jgi:hypothetical protein
MVNLHLVFFASASVYLRFLYCGRIISLQETNNCHTSYSMNKKADAIKKPKKSDVFT